MSECVELILIIICVFINAPVTKAKPETKKAFSTSQTYVFFFIFSPRGLNQLDRLDETSASRALLLMIPLKREA